MLWYFPLAIFIIFVVIQSLWQRNYAQSNLLPDTFPPALAYALVLMPISFIIGIALPHHVIWTNWLITLLLIEGIFIGLFNWFMFSALRHMPVAKFEMVFQLYVIVVIILGWVLLGEKLTLLQIAGGIALALAAYIAIQTPKNNERELKQRAHKKAIIISILAAVSLGIGLVAEKAALQYMDMGAYFIFGFATQTLAVLILASKDFSKRNIKIVKKMDLKRSGVMGLLSVFVGFSYIAAIKLSNNISIVTLLGSLSLPLTVLAGYLFLHERENMVKMWLATVLGLIGLILVAL